MSKKDFIALADAIRNSASRIDDKPLPSYPAQVEWTRDHLAVLAQFCNSQNPRFKEQRWAGYIRGENGKNGGRVKV